MRQGTNETIEELSVRTLRRGRSEGRRLVAGVIATGTATAVSFAITTGVTGGIISAVAAVVIGTAVVVIADRRRPANTAASCGMAGLVARIDERRRDAVLTEPVAAIVIELRGVAAETVVEGAAAWTEPITMLARRLAETDLDTPAQISRLGPHSFGVVASLPGRADAIAAAERLVAACREPILAAGREIRVDAVAGVAHAAVGEAASGEELLRTADAAMRVETRSAAPVATADSRLARHARRVAEIESEIRHSLDVDLLTARLMPVVDVHSDDVVGLRSGYDWTTVSRSEPEILQSVANSLGLRRSLETQYLMRSISVAGLLPGGYARPVVASIEAERLTDERAVSQIALLIKASGVEPHHLILELDGWGADTLNWDLHSRLRALEVGVGVRLRGFDGDELPLHLPVFDSVSVSATELLDEDEIVPERVERLGRLVGDDLRRVTVLEVDRASTALELSAVGLPIQCGRVHGQARTARDLRSWLLSRAG